MAPYDNLPHFRKWFEANCGRTSWLVNDMQLLGGMIKNFLGYGNKGVAKTFQVNYYNRYWKVTIVAEPSEGILLKDEILVELTDTAIDSIVAQCAFNEGEVINERKRQGNAISGSKED